MSAILSTPGTIDNKTGGTNTASVTFDLDGFGRMLETKLKGQDDKTITATYDALGQQTALNDPDKGSWTYIPNVLGHILYQKDANQTETLTTYDKLGRPIIRTATETAGGPVEKSDFYYYDGTADPASHRVALGVKGWIGAPEREETSTTGAAGYAASGSATTTVHYYDDKGRPNINLATIDGKWFYTYTNYDLYSRIQGVRYYWRPAGLEAPGNAPYIWQNFGYTYGYDSLSYVTSVADSLGRTWWTPAPSDGYDFLDRPVTVQKGSAHWTQRTYRATDNVLTGITTGPTAGSGSIQNLSFNYDGLGNLTSRTGSGGTEDITYDNLNRLASSSKQGATTYSANGNIQKKPDVNGTIPAAAFTYDGSHPHAVTSALGFTMGYDANGNVISRSNGTDTWSFRYAGFDKPRWMAKNNVGSEFVYNANRSRIMQLEFNAMSGGVPSHYVRKRIYAMGSTLEINYENQAATGSPVWNLKKVRIYVPGPDGVVGAREFDPGAGSSSTEKALVYHYEHLGSVESITAFGPTVGLANDSGGKSGRFSEDAWGQRRNTVSWSGVPTGTDDGGADSLTPRGYTGHEMLDDLGLVHMNGRIYDPVLGRFLSADVMVSNPGNLQSYNRYTYVGNNPLSTTDPSGFVSKDDEEKERKKEAEKQANFAKTKALWNTSTGPAAAASSAAGNGAVRSTPAGSQPVFASKINPIKTGLLESSPSSPSSAQAKQLEDPNSVVDYFTKTNDEVAAAGNAGEYGKVIALSVKGAFGLIGTAIKQYGATAAEKLFDAAGLVAMFPMEGRAFVQKAAAESRGLRTFYSVQGEADVARLAAGGAPWPAGLQRANLGEGLYAWGTRAEAEAYAAGKQGASILEFKMSTADYSGLRTLDMRFMSDEAATNWLGQHSLYGQGLPHGFEHIIRQTGRGTEYYFSPTAFGKF